MHESLYEKKLEELRDEIKKRLARMNQDLDFGDDVDSLEEEADETEEFANQIGLRKTFHGQLEDIDAALLKIKNGTYGKCELCHSVIDETLLEINPASQLCRACKQKK